MKILVISNALPSHICSLRIGIETTMWSTHYVFFLRTSSWLFSSVGILIHLAKVSKYEAIFENVEEGEEIKEE